jgi:hypothetical protein
VTTAIDWAPRLRVAAIAVTSLVVPVLLAWALAGSLAAFGVGIGAAMSMASAAAAGSPAARLGAPAVVAAIVLGSLTAGGWWWIVVVTVFAVIAGLAGARDATTPFVLAAVVSTIAPASSDLASALWLGGFTAIGCAYGLALAVRTGTGSQVEPRHPALRPAAEAVLLGVLGAVTSAIAWALDVEQAYWIPMTAMIVAVPTAAGTTTRARERMIGTLIGAASAMAIALLSPPRLVFAATAVFALLMTLATAGLAYRIQATFITIFVLLVGGAPHPDLVERRVVFTVIGAALLTTGAVAMAVIGRRSTDPHG